jgi:hypothetical protein
MGQLEACSKVRLRELGYSTCVLLCCFIRPFVIDLESTNGTFVNKEEIPPSRYYELKASDGNAVYT